MYLDVLCTRLYLLNYENNTSVATVGELCIQREKIKQISTYAYTRPSVGQRIDNTVTNPYHPQMTKGNPVIGRIRIISLENCELTLKPYESSGHLGQSLGQCVLSKTLANTRWP